MGMYAAVHLGNTLILWLFLMGREIKSGVFVGRLREQKKHVYEKYSYDKVLVRGI